MPRVKIAALIEEMDAAGWIFDEEQFDKWFIPFHNCETGETIAFKTWQQVDSWLDDYLEDDRMPKGIGDMERDTIQSVINVLEYVYKNPNVLPEDKLQLAYCLDTLIDLVKEEEEEEEEM